ncbi:Replication initiation factor [Edwardsiella tarda]|nr:Replication initiation factor [Edwardsiella tarda]
MNASERVAHIDYLAFSAPISCMRSVDTFSEPGHDWRKYQPVPQFSKFRRDSFAERINRDGFYEPLPDSSDFYDADLSQRNDEAERYNKALAACFYSRLRRWIAATFGLVVGPSLGRGGFAYEDSAVLYCDEGGAEHFGKLYWGGNNGTFYIQIGGLGCTHVFSGTTPDVIFKWLKHLDITSLKRLDLAVDDYDGVFTCDDAIKSYRDDAFYGGHGPKPALAISHAIDSDGCLTKEIVNVGSRQSRVFWRIYNKALEQRIKGVWYRSEVELKGISIEALLDINGTFTSLCAYAAAINPTKPKALSAVIGRKACDAIDAKVRWLRKQASSTIAKVINFMEGDIDAALSMIIRPEHAEYSKFDLPPVYQYLINERMRNMPCPF